MKLWKSPVLYFGILLVLAVAGAMIAPHVVKWDAYRADIEAYGRKLTGRAVEIRGPIEVSLFPWPDLKLSDVRVANPDGAGSPDFMRAEEIEVRVTLAGLASGQIRVEAVNLRKPEFWVERMVSGRGTWQFQPEMDLLGDEVADRFRLDRLAITDGTIHLVESRRGGEAIVEKVNVTVAGAEIRGPWKVRGTAEYGGTGLDVSLTTGTWKAAEPLKLGLRVASSDMSGLVYSLDGANDGRQFIGALRVEPASPEGGKTDAEGRFRPLVFNSRVVADFDQIRLDKIEIAPRDSVGANLLAGSAVVELGQEIRLSSDLSATRFDLDTVAGSRARQLVREGGGLELLQSLVDSLPASLEGSLKIKVLSLIAGGESIENVEAKLRAGGGTIRIDGLSAKMPGQADGLFSGVFAATDRGPQLAGDLAFEAFNLRDFISWLAPEFKEDIARTWTGSRGQLKFEGRVDAAGQSLRLTDVDFQIDETRGKAAAAFTGGTRHAASFSVDADTLDIDALLPQGVRAFAGDGATKWLDIGKLLGPLVPDSLSLRLNAERLRLNGVEARDVAISADSNQTGISIDVLRAGSIGNASLEASGLVSFASDGLAGNGSATLKADDPRDVLRLAGIVPAGATPAWTRPLGNTDMVLGLTLEPGSSGSTLTMIAGGRSGELNVDGRLRLKNLQDVTTADIESSLSISSGSAAALAGLAGLVPVEPGTYPGKVTFTAAGSLAGGLTTDLLAEAFGAQVSQKGNVRFSGDSVDASGRLLIDAADSNGLIAALGLPPASGQQLHAEADYSFKDGALSLTQVSSRLGDNRLKGRASVSSLGELAADLEVDALDLASVLGAALLPWNGGPFDLETAFAPDWPFGLKGEIWLRPARLGMFEGYALTESQIGITATPEGRRVAVFGSAPQGGKVSAEVALQSSGVAFALDGNLELPVDLALLRSKPGNLPVFDGAAGLRVKFRGVGRSPSAALAALQGSGSYSITSARLHGLDIAAFNAARRDARNAEDIRKALSLLTSGGVVDLGNSGGAITIIDGIAALVPIRVSSSDSTIETRPVATAASATLDIDISVSLQAAEALPTISMNYSGAATALVRIVDSADLESFLGMQVLHRAMSELEAVQREQQRLLEEEARQAKIDAERVAAWEAHRKELQRRLREIRVHERTRQAEAAAYAEWLEELAKQAKLELVQRNRELRIQRRIRQEADRAQKATDADDRLSTGSMTSEAGDIINGASAATPKPKIKPKPRAAGAAPPEDTFVPLVLVPPAPVQPDPVPVEQKKLPSLFDFLTQPKKKSRLNSDN